MPVSVRQATIDDLTALVPLFDGYRCFYGRDSDPDGARRFLFDRFEHRESVILIAEQDGRAVGFTQLYPSFSSTRMQRIYILNDLFVSDDARGQGAAAALLDGAEAFARKMGAAALTLSTARDNLPAQAAYEKKGWQRDQAFHVYHRLLG